MWRCFDYIFPTFYVKISQSFRGWVGCTIIIINAHIMVVAMWIYPLIWWFFSPTAEPLPTCAARIDALRSHGHYEAALRLAVSVVRTMKYNQENSRKKWHDNQLPSGCSSSRCTENHRSSPRFMPYGDHRSSPHGPPRCYDPRIRSPGPIRGSDQNGYDSHHRSSPICNSRCYCSDSHSRNLSCSPRSSYVDSYSRWVIGIYLFVNWKLKWNTSTEEPYEVKGWNDLFFMPKF